MGLTANEGWIKKCYLQSQERSTHHFPATCPADLFCDQIRGSSVISTFSSLLPNLDVYLTSGGGALLLFIGID